MTLLTDCYPTGFSLCNQSDRAVCLTVDKSKLVLFNLLSDGNKKADVNMGQQAKYRLIILIIGPSLIQTLQTLLFVTETFRF